MAETIKIPGLGPMNKKYVLVGAAGIAGFVGFAYYRSRSAGDTTDTTATDTTDTTGDTTAFDPAYDYSGYASDAAGYMGGSPVYYPPFGSSTPISSTTPTSDSDWNQRAYEVLTDRGTEGSAASHALSRYQANLCLTDAEADMVRQAIGAIGDTPQAHHNIQICAGSPPPTTGTAPTTPANFHVASTDKSGVTVDWTPVPGVTRYLIHIGGGPQKYNHSVTDTAPPYRFGALSKNSTYTFNIRSSAGGVDSPASATISGKTKAK